MRPNIVLIDFENVQPETLSGLAPDHFRVVVFVGANQTKIPFELAESLQRLGDRAEYVKIAGNGPNALDFHIAFHVGRLSASTPTAYFHIVSRDAGFDPLIAHLMSKKILAKRVGDVREIFAASSANVATPAERTEIVLQRLRRSSTNRPKTVKSLSSVVSSQFQNLLSEKEVAAVITELVAGGSITIDGPNVTYKLPEIA